MYQRIPLSFQVQEIIKLLMATLCGLLLATSVFFFIKMSSTAGKGYLLKENQLRASALKSEQRILEEQILEAQSLKNLQGSDVFSKMTPAGEAKYVAPRGPLTKR